MSSLCPENFSYGFDFDSVYSSHYQAHAQKLGLLSSNSTRVYLKKDNIRTKFALPMSFHTLRLHYHCGT